MRCGIIPVRIALSSCKHASVPHIYRNKHKLAALCGNCALAEYALLGIDVIVYRMERRHGSKSAPVKDYLSHTLTVTLCKALTYLDIIKIILKVIIIKIAEICGRIGDFRLLLFFHCL